MVFNLARASGENRPQSQTEQHQRWDEIARSHAVAAFPLRIFGEEKYVDESKQDGKGSETAVAAPELGKPGQREENRRRKNEYRLARGKQKPVETSEQRRVEVVELLGAFGCRGIAEGERASEENGIVRQEYRDSNGRGCA